MGQEVGVHTVKVVLVNFESLTLARDFQSANLRVLELGMVDNVSARECLSNFV